MATTALCGVWRRCSGLCRPTRPTSAGPLILRRALAVPPASELPLLAIVGTPNAGKSTLFNRLVGGAQLNARMFKPTALVNRLAGTTRDRLDGEAEWLDYRFRVVDTGGIEDLWPLRVEPKGDRRTLRSENGKNKGRRGRAYARRMAEENDKGLKDEPDPLPADESGARKERAAAAARRGTSVVGDAWSPPANAPLTEAEADASRKRLAAAVESQVAVAVRQAAVVLLMVDAKAGASAGTLRLAKLLRRHKSGGAAILMAANKCESPDAQHDSHELWALGLGEPRMISALHGMGTADLLDDVVLVMKEWEARRAEQRAAAAVAAGEVDAGEEDEAGVGGPAPDKEDWFPGGEDYDWEWEGDDAPRRKSDDGDEGDEQGEDGEKGEEDKEDAPARPGWAGEDAVGKVAVVGRPNVGKSSLLNRLLGEERMVVDPVAGTTRDSVSAEYEWREKRLLLIDTAGMRKKAAGGEAREELDR